MIKARVINFYSFSEREVNAMSISKLMSYHNAMLAIKADEAILDIQTSNFHSFKKEAKSKIIRNLKRQAGKYIKRYAGSLPTYGEVLKDLRSKVSGR